MAGIFQGLADYLFGVDPIDASMQKQQEEYLAQQARDYAAREQADYAHQAQYGRMLQDQISGRGAPSVAQLQLGQGYDAIARNAQSQVAGASGNNAALMSYGAMLNSGNQAAQFNQAKAIQRAQEIQSAQNQLGALYANQAQRSAGLYGQSGQLGLGYGQLATETAIANQRAQAAATGTLLSTAGTLIGGFMGSPTAAAAAGGAAGARAAGGGAPNPYAAAQPGLADSNVNYGQNGPPSTYGAALTAADQPQDPYQASYSDGLYRGPSVDRGQR